VSDNCTVVINSCDSYGDLWRPFFMLLKDQWNPCPYKIVLNTESKTFSLPGLDIRAFSLQDPNAEDSWGRRLRETLKRVDTEFVIMLFDDFMLESPVDQAKIDRCIDWMKKNERIAVFYFSNIPGTNIDDCAYPDFERLPKVKEYKLNSAPALWRRERLISFTGPSDTPWAWEFFGSARTYRTDEEFYCARIGKEDVFSYRYDLGGAIHRGKWVYSVIKPVIDRYAIDLDLSIRGVEDETLAAYPHSLKWKVGFLLTGFRMVGLDAFKFIFLSMKRKLARVFGADEK